MLGPYLRILAKPGALAFSAAGALARLPISMVTISIILLVTSVYGEYGMAGRVASVYVIAQAICAPQLAKLIDSYGQSRVMRPALAIAISSLTTLSWLAAVRVPEYLLWVFAATAGATVGSMGALVRSRWATLLDSSHDLHVAFSLESSLDEVVFIIGPMLATFLATLVSPLAGLGVAILASAVGGFWFLSQRATEPPPTPTDSKRSRPPIGWGGLGLVAVVHGAMGALFGSAEVATIAFSADHGQPGMAGALLAIWAFGSLIAGLFYGTRRFTSPTWLRFVASTVVLSVCASLFVVASTMWTLAAVMLLAGIGVAPTFIAGAALVQELVPPERLTEALTWIVTSTAVGVALGTPVAGTVVDASGGAAAYWVTLICGVLTMLVALIASPLLKRAHQPPHLR